MRRRIKQLLGPAYFAARRWFSRIFIERRLGIETATEVGLRDLGLHTDDRVDYEPSGWRDLRRILALDEVVQGDVFIDFGSGKGRVLLEAARYPFKRVIGVEISAELNRTAAANIQRVREAGTSGSTIELVTADAVDYEIPDDVTIAYFYNPFRGRAFHTVIERLLESVDRCPRFVRVIYRTPLEEDYLAATGRLRLVKTSRGRRPGRHWQHTSSLRMYVALPSGVDGRFTSRERPSPRGPGHAA